MKDSMLLDEQGYKDFGVYDTLKKHVSEHDLLGKMSDAALARRVTDELGIWCSRYIVNNARRDQGISVYEIPSKRHEMANMHLRGEIDLGSQTFEYWRKKFKCSDTTVAEAKRLAGLGRSRVRRTPARCEITTLLESWKPIPERIGLTPNQWRKKIQAGWM